MPSSAVVTGAAPAWVGTRLRDSRHRGEVIHAGSDAVYFRSHDDVIGVVSRHATSIPCTISTRLDTLDDLHDRGRPPAVGDEVVIGSGLVDFGRSQVRVARYVDFRMRAVDPGAALGMRDRLERSIGGSSRPTEIDAVVLATLRDRPVDALVEMLGKGSGLTPFGDDVVCGMIATLLAVADPCAPAVCERAVALAPVRTTSLSATLLCRSAQGDVLPAFADVVSALIDQPDHAAQRIARLLTIGHTSGAGMLLGLHCALDHIITRSCCP